MKTSDLTGAALNWAVNHAAGLTGQFSPVDYCGKWEHGGPIIEGEMIQLTPHCMVNPLHGWAAAFRSFDEDDNVYALHRMRGKTPLIAAMRCYVASKLGDDIDLPKELT